MKESKELQCIQEHVTGAASTIATLDSHKEAMVALVSRLEKCSKDGGRVYTLGNGGSACDAMHFAEELVARYHRERPGIRAQHLIDSGTITCWANDYDFDTVFARQVETLATKDDVVIGFTTSGNSPNVLNATEAANFVGAHSVIFSGKGGGKAVALAKESFIVESDSTAFIQVAHMCMIHMICDLLEQRLYPDSTWKPKRYSHYK